MHSRAAQKRLPRTGLPRLIDDCFVSIESPASSCFGRRFGLRKAMYGTVLKANFVVSHGKDERNWAWLGNENALQLALRGWVRVKVNIAARDAGACCHVTHTAPDDGPGSEAALAHFVRNVLPGFLLRSRPVLPALLCRGRLSLQDRLPHANILAGSL